MEPEILLNRLADTHKGLAELWSEGESWIIYQPGFAESLSFAEVDAGIEWQQDEMTIYGKAVKLPRLTAWYGDPGTDYVYSGIENIAKPWTPLLGSLRSRLAEDLDLSFNAVLANRYADGSQHMGYHADGETEFGVRPLIASLSFGASRRFLWKRKAKGSVAEKLMLAHGSLLIMGGDMQTQYVHAVPKSAVIHEPRINLTFRLVTSASRDRSS